MENLMDNPRSDRGQLILIGAVLIALAFVSLTLLLNTAIFSENLASRSPDTSGLTPQKVAEETNNNIGDSMNRVEFTNIDDSIDKIERANRERFNQRGIIYSMNLEDASEGRLVSEPSRTTSGEVVDGGDNNLVRELTVDIDSGENVMLELTSDSQGLLSSAEVVYEVEIDHDGDEIDIAVEQSGVADDGGTTENLADPASADCTVSVDGKQTVDITSGTVSGQECDALNIISYTNDDVEFSSFGFVTFNDGFSQIEFTDVSGDIEWGIVVESTSDIRGADVSSGSEFNRAYSTTVEITYALDNREFIREVRVSPSEPNYD